MIFPFRNKECTFCEVTDLIQFLSLLAINLLGQTVARCTTSGSFICMNLVPVCPFNGCCFNALKTQWRDIYNKSNFLGCMNFAMYDAEYNKSLSFNLTIGMFCPFENLHKVSAETVRRCEQPSNQSLEENTMHFSVKHKFFFRNYHCLKCYDPSINESQVRRIPPVRNCSMAIRQRLLKGSEEYLKKVEIYISECVATLSRTISLHVFGVNPFKGIDSFSFFQGFQRCLAKFPLKTRLPFMANVSSLDYPTPEWLCVSSPTRPVCTNTTTYQNAFCAILHNDTDYHCNNCTLEDSTDQLKISIPMDLPPLSILLDYNSQRFIRSTSFSQVVNCEALTSQEVDEGLCLMKGCGVNLMPFYLDHLKKEIWCANPKHTFQTELFIHFYFKTQLSKPDFLIKHICHTLLDLIYIHDTTFVDKCNQTKMIFRDASRVTYALQLHTPSGSFSFEGSQRGFSHCSLKFFAVNITQNLRVSDLLLTLKENITQLFQPLISQRSLGRYNETLYNIFVLTVKNSFPEICQDSEKSEGKIQLIYTYFNSTLTLNSKNTTCHVDYSSCKSSLHKIIGISQSSDRMIMKLTKKYGGKWLRLSDKRLLHFDCAFNAKTQTLITVINSIITYTCIPLSILSLLATCLVYGWYKELYSIPCMCTINLAVCNILYLSTFFATTLLRGSLSITGTACQILAIANHLFTLLTFTWCSTLSFMAACSFSSSKVNTTQHSTAQYKKILKFTACGYFPAIIYTTACMISACIPYESHLKVKYGQKASGLCILANDPVASIVIGISLPAALLLSTSVVNYFIILASILKSVRAAKGARHSDDGKSIFLRCGLKLGILLGLAWVLPMFGIIFNSDIISVLGNLLLATQGIVMSFNLLTSSQVRALIKRKRSRTSD